MVSLRFENFLIWPSRAFNADEKKLPSPEISIPLISFQCLLLAVCFCELVSVVEENQFYA